MSNLTLRALGTIFAIGTAALLAGGCGDPSTLRVQLHDRQVMGDPATVLKIDAQVSGPLQGLRYKWFAVAGQCEPQESDLPSTTFRFTDGARQDQVSVEVWRGGQCVAESHLKVSFEEKPGGPGGVVGAAPQISITLVPPSEPGGDNTHAIIRGTVRGDGVSNCFVVVYARAFGKWYIQPQDGSVLGLQAGNVWETWTHTGQKYAALLVRRNFEPLDKPDLLPEVREPVVACTVVDGVDPAQSAQNAAAAK
jgi:hypothetical protein